MRNKSTNVEPENLKRRHELEEKCVDGKMVLIWIVREWGVGI